MTLFAFRIFTEIFVAKPEVNIHSKIQSLFYNPFVPVHPALASIFTITTALHAEFLTAFVHSHFFLQPLRPATEISHLLCFSVVADSKICRGRSRNSSVVESQSYFVSERPFFRLSQTKYIFLLASLRRWALSYRQA